MRRNPTHARTSGFTLIEVLAVIVILGILMVVLLPRLSGISERAKEKMTSAWINQLQTAIGQYEDRFGDYPPSQFLEKWGTAPNTTNLGGETLVLSLWSPEWSGASLDEDKLVNTDGDETKKALTKFPKTSLFELRDEWGNPIAYFHHRDYGREDTYIVHNAETGEEGESRIKALMNPTTKTYYNSTKFQLISAGRDGEFGTDDDIGNFEKPEKN
jgi:prepilin-type N-terminal cleavage/methylation domain-containing protein